MLTSKLGGSADRPVTGSPNPGPILYALNAHKISYIVVENGEIIEHEEY